MFKRLAGVMVAAIVAIALMPGRAIAVSYPTVDDVNEWGAGKSILTVTAAGTGKLKLRATSGKKKLKVVKHHRGVWSVVVRNGRSVKLTARDAEGKRTIKFEVL